MPFVPNYAPGDVLTAAAMNSIGEGWTSFTPTWTASTTNPTLGNATLTGYYSRNNKLVTARVNLSDGSTTAEGTGTYYFALPVTASSNYSGGDPIGTGWIADGLTIYPVQVQISTTGRVQLSVIQNLLGQVVMNNVTNLVPFTFDTGDQIRFTYTYEAA